MAAADVQEKSLGPEPRLAPRRLGAAALVLLCTVFWALSHSYRGLFHDARLYTLQALSHLSPESLSQDVFLRFGSQDHFTIFSPLYATVIQVLGPESAAALLTLLSQGALLVGAWFLARSMLAPMPALLGVAVLVAIPGEYGTDRIFAVIEQFLTPRMAAEALVLGSIAAALNAHRLAALTLMALATLMHPIMAAAGVGVLLCLYALNQRPRVGAALLGAAIVLSGCAAYLAPAFDPAWLQLVRDRSPYLFVSNWLLDDWGSVAVTLATLIVGMRTLASLQARRLCQAACLTTSGGLLLSFIACDTLHVVWLTQLQPWRWQWFGIATAALLLPVILETCAVADVTGRITALLLTAASIFGANSFAIYAALSAPAALVLAPRLKPSETRWILLGAVAMLALALIWRVASNLEFTDAHYIDTRIPAWRRDAMSFVHDGSLPLCVIALTWWLMRTHRRRGLLALVSLAAAACLALLPQSWAQWNQRDFSPQRVAAFAAWRDIIPPGTQVFWPDLPLGAWLLLDRPHYLSSAQSSGMVFSRRTALELQRRAAALKSVVPLRESLAWDSAGDVYRLSPQQLQGVCRLGVVDYLVTVANLGIEPVSVMPNASDRSPNPLRLYHCGGHTAPASS
jgi:hypothetical protein